jgi:hypothetical protein
MEFFFQNPYFHFVEPHLGNTGVDGNLFLIAALVVGELDSNAFIFLIEYKISQV